jgi:hypothetical protein
MFFPALICMGVKFFDIQVLAHPMQLECSFNRAERKEREGLIRLAEKLEKKIQSRKMSARPIARQGRR